MMLDVAEEGAAPCETVLNDAVVRGAVSDMPDLEIRKAGDGMLVARHRADGIIFATPTGSTAYSMAAGGPVVSPELSLILMTAICPQSRLASCLVLSPESVYTVCESTAAPQTGLSLTLDGRKLPALKPGSRVRISRSALTARFIDLGLREFFSNFNQKLSWRG
jgi:NAD+ kinase